jgi:uncharacterized protein (DUF1778 family)
MAYADVDTEVIFMSTVKDARINVRLTRADNALIRHAADAVGQTITEFMSVSALERAHEVLADQRDFEVDERTWDTFVAALDRPVRPDPRLVELFARSSRLS